MTLRAVILNFAKVRYPFEITLRGLKIVVDCANGATYRVAPAVFKNWALK